MPAPTPPLGKNAMVFDQLEREMVEHIDGPSPDWYGLCPGDTPSYAAPISTSLASFWSRLGELWLHFKTGRSG